MVCKEGFIDENNTEQPVFDRIIYSNGVFNEGTMNMHEADGSLEAHV